MAPENSKQKRNAKQSFDDELGDDFLSSWKPTKSMAALDFEEDELTPKNGKASFSLGKMDTSFDFDFDGGLNALSKFNVDMSDLEVPSSRDKVVRKNDNSQDKQKVKSKFSFQFNGFDELDLDDTLKTKKEPETPVDSKKGKRDLSPPSTASKYCKKGFLDSLSDGVSESNSAAPADTRINKESHKTWKKGHASHQGKPSGGPTFSDDENSMHELGSPSPDKQEQAPRRSDNCTTQKRKDSAIKTSYTLAKELLKVASPTLAHGNASEEYDDRIKPGVEEPCDPNVESNKRFSDEMEVKVLSVENESQELQVEKDGLGTMYKEEQTSRVNLDEVPQITQSQKTACTENVNLGIAEEASKNEEIEQQNTLGNDVNTSQVAELDCIGSANGSLSPKRLNEPHTIHIELSPQVLQGRSAKRKFSEEQGTAETPGPKQNSSKKQEVVKISTKAEESQVSGSPTPQRKCKDLYTSPQKNHHDSPLGKIVSKLVSDRFIQGVSSLNKITKPSLIQTPRSLLRAPGKHLKLQEQTASLVKVKSPVTSFPDIAALKKPIMLGGVRSPSLPSPGQQKRSLYQLNSAKELSTTAFQVRNRPVTQEQREGLMLRKTSSVAFLSKSKAAGTLREACEKGFKFDATPSSKGTVPHPITHSSTALEKLESGEAHDDEKVPTGILEKSDTEMAEDQIIESLKTNGAEDVVPSKGEDHHWAASMENVDGLSNKSEYYANHMDQLLKELKDKYEEAMDLRIRAIVINNTFLMLNNPFDDEKISFSCKHVNFFDFTLLRSHLLKQWIF